VNFRALRPHPAGPSARPARRPGGARILWAGLALGLAAPAPLPAATGAAGEFYLRAWDTDDGLPYNTLTRIVQDARGFIWFATSGGLARYDGHRFKEIKLPKEHLIHGFNIRSLLAEDERTLLLLPTSRAVLRLRDGEFSLHPASAAVGDRQPVDLFAEAGGVLWLGMEDGALLRWENGRAQWFGPADGIRGRVVRFTFATGARGETWVATGPFLGRYQEGRLVRFETGSNQDMLIASAANGHLWVCTPTELRRLENGTWNILARDVPWQTAFASLQHLFEDRDGALWIANGRLGLRRWTPDGFSAVEAPVPTRFAMQDREGNFWVGSGGAGVALLRRKTHRIFDTRAGLAETISNGVHIGSGGEVWLANNAGGVVRLRGDRVEPLRLVADTGSPFLNTVHTDAAGHLWAGGQDGLYFTPLPGTGPLRKMPVPERNVHLLFATRRGDVWFSADPGQLGFYRDGAPRLLSAREGYAGQTIRAMAEDDEGRLWLGALNGDLLCFTEGHLTRFTAENGLPGQPIHDLRVDKSGALWIATAGGLVLREGASFHLFTQADGLADELILRVVEDDLDVLWFASRSGIYHVAKKELLARSRGAAAPVVSHRFGRDQGLTGVTPLINYQPSAGRTSDGRVWFSTAKGVVAIDPSAPHLDSPPPIFIDEVLIDNVPVPVRPGIELPPGRHRIEFRFAAPSFVALAVQINHQLENADPGWIETSDAQSAAYSGLRPGPYRLQARARSGTGAWSAAPVSFDFVVRAAWWQSPWLQFALLSLLTAGIAWGVRHWSQRLLRQRLRRLERAHALDVERARIARNLHDELGASLTEIGLLAERLRHLPGPELPSALSRLAARTRRLHIELASLIWTINPHNNSLDQLALFLRKYATRLFRHSATACRIEGADTIPAQPIAPDIQHQILAVAKEALNNILTHARATQAIITTRFADGVFHLGIADDGVGFDPAEATEAQGNGLANMRTRVAEIGGTLRLVSAPGEGARVMVDYPCRPAETSAASRPPFASARS
jgi:signal transduction histidine kinase/ligand-binding sensor domain-containing protein